MGRGRLWAEFLVLFVAAPVVIAVAFPAERMFTFLLLLTLAGIALLHRTPGFRWPELARSPAPTPWRFAAASRRNKQ